MLLRHAICVRNNAGHHAGQAALCADAMTATGKATCTTRLFHNGKPECCSGAPEEV